MSSKRMQLGLNRDNSLFGTTQRIGVIIEFCEWAYRMAEQVYGHKRGTTCVLQPQNDEKEDCLIDCPNNFQSFYLALVNDALLLVNDELLLVNDELLWMSGRG